MRVWTVQNIDVFDKVMHEGYYRSDGSHSNAGFLDARIQYDWMARILSEKSERPDDAVEPVWCWRIFPGKHDGKPDMRTVLWSDMEPEQVVRMCLDVSDDRVLLSDYMMWHISLNNGYIGLDEEDDERFYARLEAAGFDPCDLFSNSVDKHFDITKLESFENEAVESWKRCLYPLRETIGDDEWNGTKENNGVQGVIWEIRIDDVVNAEFFTTKQRKHYC